MFLVVRYSGLYFIVTYALTGSSFVPGPLRVSKVLFPSYSWTFVVFLSAADLLMILRVYAMWNRSRTVLRVLILVYVMQTIIAVVVEGIYNNHYNSVTTIQILDFSFCAVLHTNVRVSVLSGVYIVAPRLFLGALLAILAVFQTLKQSFEMYKATKIWQPNRYMRKLVKDGILYFVVNVLFQAIDLLALAGFSGSNTFLFLQAFVPIAFYTVIPRFVISIRVLYDRDIRGRFHIDTGFGVQSRSNAGADATVSAIVFEDGNRSSEPEVAGDTVASADLEMAHTVQEPNLNEDSPIQVQSRD
ncbi:hypothetical protein L210DRAFT_3105839 [Boletus edulis BED1]|uniref:Uncharacterized protein n=1 Tax=Boletus edulis BED1 TaxID=1328754 RepID=A0AAD4C021_BOLED|nr:hypothetical protein L210DRAFT_3105839 [Boletus edulis BED1]